MVESVRSSVVIVDAGGELSGAERIWGTGGWVPPEQREVLDWIELVRFLGWSCSVIQPEVLRADNFDVARVRWLILTGDAMSWSEARVAAVDASLNKLQGAVVSPAVPRDHALAALAGVAAQPSEYEADLVEWRGPGPRATWRCRKPIASRRLELSGSVPWATSKDFPLIAARRIGGMHFVTLGFSSSAARDRAGQITRLLRHMLVHGPSRPVAWLDWDATMVLRMDDPGGSQNVWYRDWSYPKLGEQQWRAVGAALKARNARLSLGYIPGWVDDGDAARGELQVGGQPVPRRPGAIYPSSQVRYLDRAGHSPGTIHDYRSEYRGIQHLRAAGLGEVELHGYTHLHPDLNAWAQAADRYHAINWFREFGEPATRALRDLSQARHPLEAGLASLQSQYSSRPVALICPGDEWTNDVLERALDLGFELVSSYYLAVRHGDRFCWCVHVCAPYLDQPNGEWLDSGLPVVGYFHDQELALQGIGWFTHHLDAWQDAGFRRFVDFRELAAALFR